MRPLLRVVSLWALAALALLSSSAFAHEMTMAEMELRESSPGEFLWQWTASGNVPPSEELKLLWPHGCSADASVVNKATTCRLFSVDKSAASASNASAVFA